MLKYCQRETPGEKENTLLKGFCWPHRRPENESDKYQRNSVAQYRRFQLPRSVIIKGHSGNRSSKTAFQHPRRSNQQQELSHIMEARNSVKEARVRHWEKIDFVLAHQTSLPALLACLGFSVHEKNKKWWKQSWFHQEETRIVYSFGLMIKLNNTQF